MLNPSLERYSRQMRFYGIAEAGQRQLAHAHVTLCGCGALGTVLANSLVRAGVGHLRLIDRDFIETHNLQRQVLFDEHDVAENLPKAEAAARKLGAINSQVHVEPIVADIDRTNILAFCQDADLILDGTDNFEVRYLINDVAVKLTKPWVYGGSIGSHGQTMTILPGQTPCLRCVFEAAPAAGEAGTCETAGVLSSIVSIVASFQAAEALKILTGHLDKVSRELIYVDVWENTLRRIKIAPLLGKVDCPCCQRRRFEWLEGDQGSQTTSLCGRNAVQVAQRMPSKLNFEEMAKHLETLGAVTFNRFLLKFSAEGHEFTVFPDGRAIIKGTSDVDRARTLYAKYIGH
jgi:molybdopterin/thiamine biosynthesis adenylyltransferase